MDLHWSPWFWEKMSVVGSCSQSLRRGGTEQDARGSSSGRVLMLKDSAESTNAALMSSMWRAEAGLPFSSNISSPIFKPEEEKMLNEHVLCLLVIHVWQSAALRYAFTRPKLRYETEPPPDAYYHLISRAISRSLYPIRLIGYDGCWGDFDSPQLVI